MSLLVSNASAEEVLSSNATETSLSGMRIASRSGSRLHGRSRPKPHVRRPPENALFEHVLLRRQSRRGPAALRLRHLRHGELEPRVDEFGVVQRETDRLALVFDEKLRIEHLEPDALAVGPVLRDSQVADVEREPARRRFGQGLESNLHDVGRAGQRLALGGLEHRQRSAIGFGGLRGDNLNAGGLGCVGGSHGADPRMFDSKLHQLDTWTSPTYSVPDERRSNRNATLRISLGSTPRSTSDAIGKRSVCITILPAPKTTSG